MFNPKYKIFKWTEDVPNLFERYEEEVVYVAYVYYGFIFRKCERVGIDKSISGALKLCEGHHSLVNPSKIFKVFIRDY